MQIPAMICPGPWELAIIACIATIIFGPWAIRRAFKGAGEIVKCGKEMKRELGEVAEELEDATK